MRRRHDRNRRETLATLAFALLILIAVLAFPFGRLHEGACSIARTVTGDSAMPCGRGVLAIHVDTRHAPFVRVSLRLF